MAELEAVRMLGRFTFNPIYVIGNKLASVLLIGSSFSVNQGAFAQKTSSQGERERDLYFSVVTGTHYGTKTPPDQQPTKLCAGV